WRPSWWSYTDLGQPGKQERSCSTPVWRSRSSWASSIQAIRGGFSGAEARGPGD
ncbi:MAG: hypothetical protein AVDCRST_MAG14-1507, partial [uncultured Rubrobacteraceae bacterium]